MFTPPCINYICNVKNGIKLAKSFKIKIASLSRKGLAISPKATPQVSEIEKL